MLVVYVKLWRIDGQKQTHIAGKSFKIQEPVDIHEALEWVESTLYDQLMEMRGEHE